MMTTTAPGRLWSPPRTAAANPCLCAAITFSEISRIARPRRVFWYEEVEEQAADVRRVSAGSSVSAEHRSIEALGEKWWRWEELNLRHGAYETPALPLSYTAGTRMPVPHHSDYHAANGI